MKCSWCLFLGRAIETADRRIELFPLASSTRFFIDVVRRRARRASHEPNGLVPANPKQRGSVYEPILQRSVTLRDACPARGSDPGRAGLIEASCGQGPARTPSPPVAAFWMCQVNHPGTLNLAQLISIVVFGSSL